MIILTTIYFTDRTDVKSFQKVIIIVSLLKNLQLIFLKYQAELELLSWTMISGLNTFIKIIQRNSIMTYIYSIKRCIILITNVWQIGLSVDHHCCVNLWKGMIQAGINLLQLLIKSDVSNFHLFSPNNVRFINWFGWWYTN